MLDQIYLKANKIICNTLFGNLSDYTYMLFGLEIEFFINIDKNMYYNKKEKVQAIFNKIRKIAYKNDIKINNIEEESGENQFEIITIPTDNVIGLANFIYQIQEESLNKDSDIILTSKPYKEEPSSGMHINVSLYDCNDINLFGPLDPREGLYQSTIYNAIAGLLDNMQNSMDIFAPTKDCYNRYIFRNQEGIFKHFPSNCSWGINNRTCAIRIPQSVTVLPSETRIEHRVPSAMAKSHQTIACILADIATGIFYKKEPTPPIYGDAFDPIYFSITKPLPINLIEAHQMRKSQNERSLLSINEELNKISSKCEIK